MPRCGGGPEATQIIRPRCASSQPTLCRQQDEPGPEAWRVVRRADVCNARDSDAFPSSRALHTSIALWSLCVWCAIDVAIGRSSHEHYISTPDVCNAGDFTSYCALRWWQIDRPARCHLTYGKLPLRLCSPPLHHVQSCTTMRWPAHIINLKNLGLTSSDDSDDPVRQCSLGSPVGSRAAALATRIRT